MELHVIEREGRKTVVLLDNEMRIVKPVYDYLKFQRQKDKALNTLKASGSDLRTYWEFLNDNGYEYDKVTPKMIAEFIDYLRASDDDVIALNKESKRTNKTINRILSTIHMFYQFEADMQEIDNPILMHDINRPFNAFKGILEHAKSDNKTKQSIFKVKESDYKINLVTDDEMELFLNRLDKRRDILLYKMLYLTGARIQEVLDLEIDSVPLPDMSQLVGCFRQIKSKGKTRDLYVPMSLIKELDDFIMEERNLIDTDHSYIFVSEQKRQLGKQLTYRAAYVPQFHLPKTETANQLWNTKKSMRTNKTKPIPEDVFDKILYHAVHDEKDALTKAGIIIQSQTGLRINEVLSIQEGCVKRTSDGYDYMEVTLGKTEKGEPIIHKVFINGLVKNAIAELTEHTAELRKESGLKELFLCRIKSQNNKIAPYTETHWNDKKLRYFIERHDIRDNKGDLYPLTSHQFRSTFVRELIKRKVPIAMIMKQYSHISIEMTAHYLTLQEEEVKEIYSDMILSPESKIAGLRAKEIKGKLDDLFHGKTEDEIDDVISGLAKTMSFNPLPTGVCLYDFRRGNCTDGDGCFFYNCPNYITEVQFYPILKDELDLLEKEMARLKELGQEPAYQVQAVKYKYLKPLVESLEVQLNGKESVG